MFPLCKIPMASEVSGLELARESRLALFEFLQESGVNMCCARNIGKIDFVKWSSATQRKLR